MEPHPNPQSSASWISPPWTGPKVSLMHPSVLSWVEGIVRDNDLSALPTLEVGSMNVNGSVRPFFTGRYLGVDIAPGPGVDLVMDMGEFDGTLDSDWTVVVSTECLEHVRRPWRAVAQMANLCEPEGHVIITARGYDERGCWEVHAHPVDAYRFSELAMRTLAEDAGLTVQECSADPEGPGWFLYARK